MRTVPGKLGFLHRLLLWVRKAYSGHPTHDIHDVVTAYLGVVKQIIHEVPAVVRDSSLVEKRS